MDDLISRQAAINALGDEPEVWSGKDEYEMGLNNQWHYDVNSLKAVPSAGPEPLTDKEQRIFLAAMGREEEVCKRVDEECRNCREPYEDILIRTCREIIRKVKGALWT